MKSITIHGIDDQMDKLIRRRAVTQGNSLNKTIKELLSSSLGINGASQKAKEEHFKKFFGIWSKKEADEIEKSLEVFERIDEEDWLPTYYL